MSAIMAMVANVVKKATQSTPSSVYFSLWTWGKNTYGQLGLNDTVYRSSPVQVGNENYSWVVPSQSFTFFQKQNGTLWSCGTNIHGQLGLNESGNYRSSPTQIGTQAWNIKSGDVGLYSTVFVKGDGTLLTWGNNYRAQLGLNDTINRSSPTQVGSLTNWKYCAAGAIHTVATKTDGTLWTWGYNAYGQLGLNDTVYRSSPVQVGTDTNWDVPKCSSLGSLTCITKTDGTLWAFGDDSFATLGVGGSIRTSSPVQIASSNIWSSVSLGYYAAFFIKPNNTLWASGYNSEGRLGLNDSINRNSPTQIGADTNWSANNIVDYPVAIKTDGTMWTWGGGYYGSGLNDTSYRSSPVQVGTDTTWSKVYGKTGSTFALKSSTNNDIPPEVPPSTSFDLYTWGYNVNGQLALNDTTYRSSPVQVGTDKWSHVSQTTGVKTDGTLWAWGINNDGQLGQNNTISKSSPIQIGALTNWLKTQTGYNSIFALKTDGTLWAWGRNNTQTYTSFARGHLGLNDAISRSSPVQVGTDNNWSKISSFYAGILAIKTDGTLWTWGGNTQGELGLNDAVNTNYRSSPVQIGSDTNWSKIARAVYASYAIKTDGTLWTWGNDSYGQLGLNTSNINKSSPVQIGANNNWNNFATSAQTVAAIKTDGTLWTWGNNDYGQLGQDNIGTSFSNRSSPVQVGTGANWVRVAFGYGNFTQATKTDGTLWTWGINNSGQLGQNNMINRSSPVQVGTESTWNTTSGTAYFNN